MNLLLPVILCGGSGERLWPASRSGFPKQFLCLTGTQSLFQATCRRTSALADAGVASVGGAIVVARDEHRFIVAEQLREIGAPAARLLLEPAGRNTAPALALAAQASMEDGADPLLLVMPSDHAMADTAAFIAAVRRGLPLAAQGAFVLFGVRPDRAETGYGYIRCAQALDADGEVLAVDRFLEKPAQEVARELVAGGNHFWNAGILLVRASVWLRALAQLRPDIAAATREAWLARADDGPFTRPGATQFLQVPAESIDRAVCERLAGSGFAAAMVRLDAGWSDVGAWDAAWRVLEKDDAGNARHGDVIAHDSRNTLAHASSRLVVLLGVQDVSVIETPDAVLVAGRAASQDVRRVVDMLRAQDRPEHLLHLRVHRPWGWYHTLEEREGSRVKRLVLRPGAAISLQRHKWRSEHWIVVRGRAQVTCAGRTALLGENESTFIPAGALHRLANPGDSPLEVIEVQTGSYVGEDDIERFDEQPVSP